MFTPGPVEVVVALLVSLRRYGFGRTLLGAVVVAVGIQPLLPPVACGCFRPLLRRCDNSIRIKAALKSDLKNLASQQEIYFSEVGSYSDDPVALAFTEWDGVNVEIRAGKAGWTAWASHGVFGIGEGCAIYHGEGPPRLGGAPGWADLLHGASPGELVCT